MEEMDLLFRFASPDRLRKQVVFMFLQYLARTPTSELPDDTPNLAEDVWFLINFFDTIELTKEAA